MPLQLEMGRSKQLMVEVYLRSVKVFRLQPGGISTYITLNASRKSTLGQFIFMAGQQFSVPPHKAKLWLITVSFYLSDLCE